MNNNDKTILVTQPLMPSYDDFCDKLKSVWSNKWLTNNGPFHIEFQCKLKEYFNIENVSLFCNGHLALYTALRALDLSGEVITTPYSFSSTTHAICQCGLTPVFCDINPNDYTIDVSKIEELITDKTSAILAVHVYGNICDVKEIDRIAKKYNLKVIYDAAHAFGEEIDGRSVAEYGDISMFSFHATKVFNSIEGGCLCYRDKCLEEKIETFKNFGIRNAEEVIQVGMNAKMNEFSAIMGILNLEKVDSEILKRKKLVDKYCELLNGVNGIIILDYSGDYKRNYSYFSILVDEELFGVSRDYVSDELKKHNIFVRKYFYPLITEYECYRDSFNSCLTPIALEVSREVLTLPLYGELELDDVSRICSIILNMR